ncbi:MAG: cell envelope integrity protein CreD [Burkholderiales bacterium]|nr:cell envelope integrity protein CreD [Burkholderiales bacterium]
MQIELLCLGYRRCVEGPDYPAAWARSITPASVRASITDRNVRDDRRRAPTRTHGPVGGCGSSDLHGDFTPPSGGAKHPRASVNSISEAKMQKALVLKTLVVAAIAIALLVPLAMIESVVAEHATRRKEAVASVQASLAGPQTIIVPFIVWPYREEWEQTAQEGGETRKLRLSRTDALTIYADSASVDATVKVKADHYRGLHQVRTYAMTLAMQLAFAVPDRKGVQPQNRNATLTWGTPYLAIGLADMRGLRGGTRVVVDGAPVELAQGTGGLLADGSVHAFLPQPNDTRIAVELALELVGVERLALVPTATINELRLRADWPHPSFGGRFLPVERAIGGDGFTARWSVAALTSSARQAIAERPTTGATLTNEAFSVDLVEPVNIYLLAERATKNGALFIALVIGTVFLIETLRRLPVHPIQYALVGLALATFFLLLLSLSEHLPFLLSYSAAATACTLLIGVYLGYALRNTRLALSIGASLALVYGALYAILIAETLALLMRSLLLFVALAAIMLGTRKVDWYGLTPPARA